MDEIEGEISQRRREKKSLIRDRPKDVETKRTLRTTSSSSTSASNSSGDGKETSNVNRKASVNGTDNSAETNAGEIHEENEHEEIPLLEVRIIDKK